MKLEYKQLLQRVANKHGLHIVKRPLDNGFLLAVYGQDGKALVYRSVMQTSSERAYDIMYPQAYFASCDYLGISRWTYLKD